MSEIHNKNTKWTLQGTCTSQKQKTLSMDPEILTVTDRKFKTNNN